MAGLTIGKHWAQWCGPCRQVSPVLEAIAAERAGTVDVVKLNVHENPRTTQRYGIMLVPILNRFSGGEAVKQVIGAKSKSALPRDFGEYLTARQPGRPGPEKAAGGR